MIPRTFPSIVEAFQTKMVVYVLPNTTGLKAWIDYIPVKGVQIESFSLADTYANNGYKSVSALTNLTGKQAWIDYIPVYEDASYNKPWSTDAGGYIPTSALAALLLDFTSGRLDPRITFSRTTNATVTGSNGLIQFAPMNLLTFSEQFDNAGWTKAAATVTANAVVAPNSTTTADKLVESATTSNHYLYPTSFTAGTYTVSIWCKAAERSFVQIAGTISVNDFVTFNLSSGSISQQGSGASNAVIVASGDGWYRCSVILTLNSSGPCFVVCSTGTGGWLPSYAGSTSNGIYIWGSQVELGSTATTYNPTTVKNLLGFTENFDNAAWTKSNATITSGFTDIYGQPFAQKLVENTANGAHVMQVNVSGLVSGTSYVASVYAKAGERTKFDILAGAGTGTGSTVFDLVAVTATGGGTITDVGNGWYRCSVTLVPNSGLVQYLLRLYNGATASYTGDGTSGIFIFGAQLSDSASVDPYVYQPVAAPTSTAYYGPRFDYDPVTLAPKGLLIEEQRTNLLLQSDGGVGWGTNGTATVTSDTGTAPNGTNTAFTLTNATDVVVPTGGNNVFKTFSVSSNTAITISLYVKAITATTVSLNIFDGATGNSSSQAITLTSAWQRVQVTRTSGASTTAMRFTIGAANGTVLCWGAQAEAGAFATSYIPTVASQVTRAADSASMIGNNFARWYNVNEGTFYSQAVQNATNSTAAFAASMDDSSVGGDASIVLFYFNNTARSIQLTAYNPSGSIQVDMSGNTPLLTQGVAKKAAWALKTNDFAQASDGGSVNTDTSGAMPAPNVFGLGYRVSSPGGYLNGTIARIAYYPRRLANTELQGITS